ncbi:hypothetical protein RF11_10743 [Thelohanellus kitauei]|uniref:Tc1-like transposase DDE domain-containing protein n=1 Tax=Thelohanellus kitauei TaxID=669202 RepID=A0A0C2JH02_THEKT|nr:hypothetical protein RF11_10743 [Thelohanellus kitauei]
MQVSRCKEDCYKVGERRLENGMPNFKNSQYSIPDRKTYTNLVREIENKIYELVADICTKTQELIYKLELNKNNYCWKITIQIPEKRNDPEVKAERKYYFCDPVQFAHIYITRMVKDMHNPKSNRSTLTPSNCQHATYVNRYSIVMYDAVVGCGVNVETFSGYLRRLVEFHHTSVKNFDDYPVDVKFLPRYSPFLAPCEEVFSMFNNRLTRDGIPRGTSDFFPRMIDACQ